MSDSAKVSHPLVSGLRVVVWVVLAATGGLLATWLLLRRNPIASLSGESLMVALLVLSVGVLICAGALIVRTKPGIGRLVDVPAYVLAGGLVTFFVLAYMHDVALRGQPNARVSANVCGVSVAGLSLVALPVAYAVRRWGRTPLAIDAVLVTFAALLLARVAFMFWRETWVGFQWRWVADPSYLDAALRSILGDLPPLAVGTVLTALYFLYNRRITWRHAILAGTVLVVLLLVFNLSLGR